MTSKLYRGAPPFGRKLGSPKLAQHRLACLALLPAASRAHHKTWKDIRYNCKRGCVDLRTELVLGPSRRLDCMCAHCADLRWCRDSLPLFVRVCWWALRSLLLCGRCSVKAKGKAMRLRCERLVFGSWCGQAGDPCRAK